MKKIQIALILASGFLTTFNARSAEINFDQPDIKRWSIEWGWNNEIYQKSDIHFKGADHDFTLYAVAATDTQKTLTPKTLFTTYLNPAKISIPQTNFRVAYQLSADTAVGLNLDHMKYVVTDGQNVSASGRYLNQSYATEKYQYLSPSFMHYEHTDGLNVVTLEYEKKFALTNMPGNISARAFALVGAGIVIPKSNITLTMMGQPRNDKFHLAGTNIDIAGGVEIDFLKNYFARTTFKFGSIRLTDVITSARQDTASQNIQYQEASVTLGVRF